jgi:dTDP-4-dehydrorhamnose reductase
LEVISFYAVIKIMQKILLLGKTGQLGWELERTLQPLGCVVARDYPEVNMADPLSIRKTVQEYRPEMIVNATAYTSVDKAESEPELAEAINGTGPGVLAEEARKTSALLIHYSTDYVFDGGNGKPYREIDLPNPLNIYGTSKLHGEQAIQSIDPDYLILRTAWIYSTRLDSFVSKVLKWAHENETLRIVSDQISNPTWARMLAEITGQILACGIEYVNEQKGLYHVAGSGFTSRLEWAKLILEFDPDRNKQKVKQILPALSSDFLTPAKRPLFSALDCNKFNTAFHVCLPEWETSLYLAMNPERR